MIYIYNIYIYIILYNYHQLLMFDDFFYHKPVTGTTGTNLDGITRATQVSVGSFQVRNSGDTQIPVVQMECERLFSVGMIWMVNFFPEKLLNFVWFDHFSDHFDFDFGWFWMHEFNLMIEKLKRRKLLGINIASGTILHFAKTTPLVKTAAKRKVVAKSWRITRQVCKENTIVNMDTGLGKTLVAVMSTLVAWNSSKFISSWNFGCWPASWHFQCN